MQKGVQGISQMKLLIDSNVILDYLADRVPFAQSADTIFSLCSSGDITGFMTASAVTDIYYVVRKAVGHRMALENIRLVSGLLEITEVCKSDIVCALEMDMPDFEDAVISVCAKREKADYIITRDVKDFSKARTTAMMPDDFLRLHFPYLFTQTGKKTTLLSE